MPKPSKNPHSALERLPNAQPENALAIAASSPNADTSERATRSPATKPGPANPSARCDRRRKAATQRESSLSPRVSVGNALCEVGFDEHAVAQQWVRLVRRLNRRGADNRSGRRRLLVDVLKECSRQLNHSLERRTADSPTFVQLVHAVSRPQRVMTALDSTITSTAVDVPLEEASQSGDVGEVLDPASADAASLCREPATTNLSEEDR